jgi:hypothetical protein
LAVPSEGDLAGCGGNVYRTWQRQEEPCALAIASLQDAGVQGESLSLLSSLLSFYFISLTLFSLLFFQDFIETMRKELDEAQHPDEGSIERALPGVNRRFDGVEAAMKAGFRKLEERFFREMEYRRSNSEEGRNDAKRQRLDLAMQLAKVAMDMARDGGESGGNGEGVGVLVRGLSNVGIGGGESADDGAGIGLGHDIQGRKPQSVHGIYNEYFGLMAFVNVPVERGLFGLEKRHGKVWRKHFSPADSKFFSRMTQVVEAVDRQVEEKKAGLQAAETSGLLHATLDEFDVLFEEKNKSMSAFISFLQSEGKIPKRGRTSR